MVSNPTVDDLPRKFKQLSDAEHAALDELFAELDRAIELAGPRCDQSGRCCRFVEYDHTLFMTRIEACRLLGAGLPDGAVINDPNRCPYQIQGLCTAREKRPLGCRIYFCDPSFADRMPDLSQHFLERIAALCRHFGYEWDYQPLHAHLAEWRVEHPTEIAPRHSLLPIVPTTPEA